MLRGARSLSSLTRNSRFNHGPEAMSVESGVGTFGKAHLAGWVPTVTNDEQPLFDVATTTASRLQEMLAAREITSVQILNEYYRQILTYNAYLKGVYRLFPGALDRAKDLDAKRSAGTLLGPLHGIPVLLKDNVSTEASMKMDNAGGNLALVGSTAIKNAPIVDRLHAAGAIILGKTTLSEMMWFKDPGIRCGWAALHGQSQNPYIEGGVDKSDGLGGHSSPGGSSSGSGISVAAGFAPMAIGTETEGSLISPSTRQSLYTIKPTLGTAPNAGIMPVSCYLDVPGPMCRSVKDTADLLTVLVGPDHPNIPAGGFAAAMKGADGWKELNIGTLDPVKFRYDSSLQTPVPEAIEQIHQATLDGFERIKSLAQSYHEYVDLRPTQDFDLDGQNSLVELMVADFEPDFNQYLKGMTDSKVSSAKELAEWNKAHADVVLPPEYPSQEFIERSIAFDHSSDRRQRLMDHISSVGKSLPDTLEKHGLDVIIGPADSWFSKYSAATGYPLCALPLSYIAYNGRPVGLEAVAKSEATLVTLMSAFEASFPERKPPTAYLTQKSPINA